MAHRLLRIYPTYLIVIALLAAVSPILIDRPSTFDPIGLSLVPAGSRFYALGIEWTLLFEITFYVGLFAAALCKLTNRLEIVALAWLGLIGCLLLVSTVEHVHHTADPAVAIPRGQHRLRCR